MKKILFVLTMLLLPAAVFAKGDIIGYAAGWTSQPSEAKLDKVTHVMVFQIIPQSSGALDLSYVPNWLDGFVTTAHSKGVKVSIAVGGWTSESEESPSYASAAGANRSTFVNNLKNFVNTHNLDGIDIDWEYPQGTTGWNNFISLCSDLKAALPGKRISAALSGETPNTSNFPGNVRSGIWNALDAIHIMAYDMQDEWPTHADATKAKQLIDAWANFGSGQPGFDKEKLILGTAFYGYVGDDQVAYNQGGGTGCDSPTTLEDKFNYTWDKGYGGVMIWELSQDNNNLTLLSALYKAKTIKLGGEQQATNYNISVTYNAGGSVKNGNNTVSSGNSVSVQSGGSLTLTITANSGYSISDVKVDNVSQGKIGTYTFSNVTANKSINVTFTQNGTNPPTPTDAPDLADGSWDWDKTMDTENRGSSVSYNVAPGDVSFSLKIGTSDEEKNIWTWAEIASYPGGDWTQVTGITITYTSDKPILITLQDNIGLAEDGRGYCYTLAAGTNKTETIPISSFKSWDEEWEHQTNLSTSQLGIFEGVSISPNDENVMTTGSIKSLKVNGLVVEEEEPEPGPNAIAQNKTKTISGAGVSVINGNINMSLPVSASNANIVLFDVRGRILFERSVAISGNFASVALPKSILRNQAAILQVKTNSGFNMTKRILIK